VFCGIMSIWIAAQAWPNRLRFAGYGLLLAAVSYVTPIVLTPFSARNIYDQQMQMGRFVQEHYKKPFAVNDLGWVSYRLDPSIYVLDLWGLASNEAVRQARKTPAWLDEITRRHGAGLAMIYDEWFEGIPASWTKVGILRLSSASIVASDPVTFYATGAGDPAEIRRQLNAFAPSLPKGVVLDIR
jgi:hypothetical protein